MPGDPLDDGPPLMTRRFTRGDLFEVRRSLADHVAGQGLTGTRAQDFVLAVHESMTNAIDHGGGSGQLQLWRTDRLLCCQISDKGPGMPDGRHDGFLDGCRLPDHDSVGGRGLWIIAQLSDVAHVVSGAGGTVVQIAVRLPG
ncbi:ATP-binding protein [Nonomuraea sp. NN258]|uniref:ATP-binding protein n=1 Tax=Nonomuraea antri TaxID=2730852 RepID=UPI0015692FC9|nr:ATP-binding protein [Nonomuraea antri]NRQ37346.1 ATP-binding protein [Nonomuraea antri]